jgi:hypothetical protein
MKKILLICTGLCAIGMKTVLAQSTSSIDCLLDTCIRRTVIDYFDYWAPLYPNSIPKRYITFLTDTSIKNIPDSICGRPTKIVPYKKLKNLKYRKFLKEKNYRIVINTIAPDTIDINLIVFSSIKFKWGKVYGEIECGGTMGYIPDGRFIFNATSRKWDYYSYDYIYSEKIKNYEYRL